MKNQLDLIITAGALIVAVFFAGMFMFTARKPQPPPAVQQVVVTPVKAPAADVPMINGLAPASTQGAAGGGGGRGSAASGGRRGGGARG